MSEMKSLQVLDRFSGLFGKMGVDYPVMRRILQVKLTMDGRRVPTIVGKTRKAKQAGANDSNQFFRSLWLYALFGVMSSTFVLMGNNFIFQMSLIFGIFMFMIMTSLISDFSSVLLDVRDRTILSTKPVSRRTIAMAKTMHILIYMFYLTAAIAVVPLAAGLIRHGVTFFLIFLAELILMDLLIVVITALLYLAVLRFFDGEKLKDIINYVQIGLTIGITVGYQLLIRLFDFVDFGIAFQPKWWQFFIAPVWFGAPFETLLHRSSEPLFVVFSLLCLAVPLLAFYAYIKLMPALERNLQKLADPGGRKAKGGGKWLARVANLVCSSPQEKVFFRFAWSMIGKEREFKLKVYPTLGFSIIFPFIFLFSNGFEGGLQDLSGSRKVLFIYFCGLLVPTVIMMLRYSGKYKAAWIYQALPIRSVGSVYKGALLACLVRLLLPLYLIEGVLFAVLFGGAAIPDLLVVGLALALYAVICFACLRKALPFSEPFEAAQQSEGMRMIPLMLMLGGFGLLHFVATTFHYGLPGYALLLIAANIIAWRLVFGVKPLKRKGA